MHLIRLTPRAQKDIESFPHHIQKRIYKKLRDNANLDDPLVRAEPLVNLPPSTHRFRIGDYRASFYIDGGVIFVERVGIRDKAYRRD